MLCASAWLRSKSIIYMLTLADILHALVDQRPTWANMVITDAVVDSRQVIPGALFVAMPGEHVDGHDFVRNAFNQGASIALVQRDLSAEVSTLDLRSDQKADLSSTPKIPLALRVENTLSALQKIAKYWRQQQDIRVIGITGSVGKSTTKELVTTVLEQRYSTLKNAGNLNNEIGLPLTLLSLSPGHRRAVLEMGLYVPGEIALLCDLAQPQVGVITNVGTVHAERAGSQEAIARGKAELVEALPVAPDGVAILNYDDLWVREMAEKTLARVFYYGLDPQADLWADQVEGLGLDGIRFRLHYRNEVLHLRVPLIGRHSVHTALRAAAVGLIEGLSWQEIIGGLRSGHTQLRLVAVRTSSGALLLDDTYNASPQSTLAALNLLAEMNGRKIAVLGDMLELGPYEYNGHWKVGIRASSVADVLITIGERSRTIAAAARQAGFASQNMEEFDNAEQASSHLRHRLQGDDIVLIKGSRGMHMDRIVATLEAQK
jgi:UDP-N-acetylmuramoyl-tripeptide--D-alanyl-D-alanine ligase